MRYVDENDPGGIQARDGEGIDDAVEFLAACLGEVLEDACRRGGQCRLDGIGARAVIVLHQQVRARRDQPLVILGNQQHAAGAERLHLLELRGKRVEGNVDARDADQLAARHDGIGDRAHGRRNIGALRQIGRRDRALAAVGGKLPPGGSVIIVEGRELDAAVLRLGPVGRKGALVVDALILVAGKLGRLAIQRAELLAEPAAEGKGILFDIRLEDVDHALAVESMALVTATDDGGHRTGGARQFADIGGDFVGDGLGLGIGLIHRQRLDAIPGLGNQQKVGNQQDNCDRQPGDQDQLGRKRLHTKDEHHFLENAMRRIHIIRMQGRRRMALSWGRREKSCRCRRAIHARPEENDMEAQKFN